MSLENSDHFVQEEAKSKSIPEITVQFKKTKVYGKVTIPSECARILRQLYAEDTIQVQEQFMALFLNQSNEVIGYYRHTVGGLASTIVEPKLILAAAVKSLSKAIILAHNHPSGSRKISEQDKAITEKMKQAAKLFDMQVLDHIILTEDGYTSFAEEGLAGPYDVEQTEPIMAYENRSKNFYSDDARNMAKYALQKFVVRGEGIKQLKTVNREFNYGKHKVRLSDGKLFVKHADSKVNYEFPLQSIYNEVLDELDDPYKMEEEPEQSAAKSKKAVKPKTEAIRVNTKDAQEVERIEEEVKFIKRYVLLHGKEKTDLQLLNVLSALQKAILEKRIRKTSKFKKEIEFIQDDLVSRVNRLEKIRKPENRKEVVKIAPTMLNKLVSIAGSEKVRLSVNYLKRYIGMQGKNLTKEKAERLMRLLENAAKSKKIRKQDPFARKIETIHKSLWQFVNKAKPKDTLAIHGEVLNGINDILGCGCDEKKKSVPLK